MPDHIYYVLRDKVTGKLHCGHYSRTTPKLYRRKDAETTLTKWRNWYPEGRKDNWEIAIATLVVNSLDDIKCSEQ